MPDEKDNNLCLFLAPICAVVDNISLEEALQKFGLSKSDVIKPWVATQSSAAAFEYAGELIESQISKIKKEEGSDLYVVKKVFCNPTEYEDVAKAVSDENTDKFNVLRIIGSNPQIMAYKQGNTGIEIYLAYGKTPVEAMKKTTSGQPLYNYSDSPLRIKKLEKFDSLITDLIYSHTLESARKAIEFIQEI